MSKNRNFILKWTLILILITVLSKILGFIREIVIAYVFGAGLETDAYFIALLLPGLIFTAFHDFINRAFIPVYGGIRKDKNSAVFVNSTALLLLSLLVVIMIFIQLLAPQIARILAPGFSGGQLALTITLIRIISCSLFFISLSGFVSGYLRAHHLFLGPGVTGLPLNIIIIFGTIYFGATFGIISLAYLTVAAYAGSFLILLPWLFRSGYTIKTDIDVRHRGIKELKLLLPPLILAGAAGEIKALIDRIFASLLPTGAVSALSYAAKVRDLPQAILVSSLTTVIFPTLVDLAVENNIDQFKTLLIKNIRIIIFITMPLATITLVLGQQIIRLIFERGAFTGEATIITGSMLIFFSIGIVGSGISHILNSAYFALKDLKTPMRITIFLAVLNGVLNALLIGPLKHAGIALATSICFVSGACLSIYYLHKRLIFKDLGAIIKTAFYSLLASSGMGISIYLISRFLTNLYQPLSFLDQLLQLMVITGFGLIVYLLLMLILKSEEIMMVIGLYSTIRNKYLSKRAN